jgi:hypothetical protein
MVTFTNAERLAADNIDISLLGPRALLGPDADWAHMYARLVHLLKWADVESHVAQVRRRG